MNHLLYIPASPRGNASHSTGVAQVFLSEPDWRGRAFSDGDREIDDWASEAQPAASSEFS